MMAKCVRIHECGRPRADRYFGETPALVTRSQAAITGLAPPFLRELAGRLWELDKVTLETNRQLRIALRPVAEGGSTEPVIDQALASLDTSTRQLYRTFLEILRKRSARRFRDFQTRL